MGKAKDSVLALRQRPFDMLLVAFYSFFLFTSATTDYHNVLAPSLGMTVTELKQADTAGPLNWPPQFITDIYYHWGVTVDPLLIDNPVFFQIMEWINILFLNPGNVIMLLAFYHGKSNWRAFGIIHASALLYSAFPCIGLGLFGEIPATNKLQFVLIYGLYATFPVAILARLWPNDRNLFSQKVIDNKNFLHKFIELFTVLHTVVFFTTVGFWLYEHWNFLLHLDYSPLRVF